jgi:hypothetical protein
MAPAIEVNNGTLPNVQLHFIAPLAFSRSNGMSTEFGPGDLEFGVKYRFLTAEPDDWWPQIGIFPMLEARPVTRNGTSVRAAPMPSCPYGCRRIPENG